MHSLHRLSSFIHSQDGQYIIYVNRIWKKEDNKYYTNLEYIKKDQNPAVPIEITPSVSEHSDSDPIFSSEFPNLLFFLRTESGSSNIYYIDFPPTKNSDPKKLTSYEINISNLKFQKNTLVFSAEVYYECKDFNCTKEKDDEVAN